MKLLLDIGNTRVKWALLQGGALGGALSQGGAIARVGAPGQGGALGQGGAIPRSGAPGQGGALSQGEAIARGGEWLPVLDGIPLDSTPEEVWVASVAGSAVEGEITAAARERWNLTPWFARSAAEAQGLRNSYRDPSRMGVDRWLGMLAAWRRVGGAVCVVDAGSALTVDLVSAAGEHVGGYILPGLGSMERALLNDTARVLPDRGDGGGDGAAPNRGGDSGDGAAPNRGGDSVDGAAKAGRMGGREDATLNPGRSTREAVDNGLLLAQVGAVALAVERHAQGFALVVTGGDGDRLLQALAAPGDWVPNLVLDGLALAGGDASR